MKKSTKALVKVGITAIAEGVFLGDTILTITGKNNCKNEVELICRLGIDIIGLIASHQLNKLSGMEYSSEAFNEIAKAIAEQTVENEDSEEVNVNEEA